MSINPSAESQRKRYPPQITPDSDRYRSMTTQPPQQSPQTLPFMAGATDMSRPWPHSTASYLDVSHVPARNHFYNTTYNTGGVSAEYQTPATTEPWRTRNANLVGPAYVSPYPDSWQSCGERVPVSVSGNPAWQQSSPGFADYQQISPSRSDGSSSTHLSSVPSPYANQIPFIKAEEYSNSAPYNTQYSLDHGLHNQSSFAGSEHYTTDPTVPRKPFHPSMVSTAHHPEDVKYTYDSDQSYDTESLSLGSGPRMLNPDFSPRRGFATPEAATCQCDVCGKQFHRTNNLLTHKQTHDPERSHPHKCTVPDCGRGFVRKTDLVRHEQSVHLKERKHQCDLCGNAFARKDTLTRHIDDGCSKRPKVRKSETSKSRRPSAQRSPSYMVNSPSPASSPLRYPMS